MKIRILFFSILVVILFNGTATYALMDNQKYWAGLEGEFERPKVDSSASGMAIFKTTQDSIWYLINITGIDKVTSAHIHSGALGENGPVLAWLFKPNYTHRGNINGTLTEGNITANMLVGQTSASHQLSEIVSRMKNGTSYIDVHTVDYPSGEIRGQIMSVNSTHAELMM